MKSTTTTEGRVRIVLTPWEFKLCVLALKKYGPDSPEAAQYPEEFWSFVKQMRGELALLDFMEEIQGPNDKGLAGPMPKLQ